MAKRNGTAAALTESEKDGKPLIDILKSVEPLTFTTEEIEGMRVMCDASVPTCIYDGVMSAVRKIDLFLGRRVTLEEMMERYKAAHPSAGPEPSEVARIDPAVKLVPVEALVACTKGHEWTATEEKAIGDDKGLPFNGRTLYPSRCPACHATWRSIHPVAGR